MVPVLRPWSLFVVSGFLLAGPVALPGPALAQEPPSPSPSPSPAPAPAGEQPAAPADPGGACAATGYLVGSDEELTRLREDLTERGVHRADGVPLDRERTWVVPDGSRPVVVLDSATPVLSTGTVSVTLAGQEFEVASNPFDEPRNRFVSTVAMPHLGPTVRSLGLTVTSEPCQLSVALSVDRSLWSTVVGAAAVGLAVLGGLLTVLVGRLRKGGWLRRFGFAAPLGLLAGLGLAAVLVEAGVVSPFAGVPWWPPAAGLGLAAALPLTRWRRGPAAAAVPAPAVPVPVHAPLGGYRLDEVVAGTEVARIYRATRVRVDPDAAGPAGPGGERALVKVVVAERYGEPAARLRIDREAAALSGLAHPNLLRLRESVAGAAGPDGSAPPALVFDDVAGAPLRGLFDGGGGLSGPQAVSVALGVLAGLGAVHARELVHRDLRPENVWLAVDGTVLLGGFELACPGVEHPVAPEGVAPYTSPEQRAGRVLDGRSDLWACGVLLAELLTGQARPDPAGLPDPLARVLARALAEDPADRPATAGQLAAELREAAGLAFGADWTGRGALAGAVVAHGAVGAAAGGYALAGAAGLGAGAGAGGGAGVVAGAVGLGAAGVAAGTETGVLGAAAGGSSATGATTTVVPAVPAGSTGAAGTGPVGGLVNAAVAIVAGVAITVGVVVIDPEPARAEPVLVTPEQAHVIFVRTMDEGWDSGFNHFAEAAEETFGQLLEEDESLADGRLVEVRVGVPRNQLEYPIWFVASALVPFEDGTASVFARFDRESADQPWLMTTLNWSTERLLPGPLLDPDGWLAPAPEIIDLLLDPERLPQQYHDWLVRANEAGEVGADELLTLRFDDSGMIFWFTEDVPFFEGDDTEPFSYEYEMSLGEVITDLVPLVDSTVQVTFTSVIRQTTYNTPDLRAVSCDQFSLVWSNDDPPGDFRWLAQDLVVDVEAWVPIVDAVPEPTPGPTPTPEPTGTPDPEPDQPAGELELEPVDTTEIVIEDWSYHTDNRDGQRC